MISLALGDMVRLILCVVWMYVDVVWSVLVVSSTSSQYLSGSIWYGEGRKWVYITSLLLFRILFLFSGRLVWFGLID